MGRIKSIKSESNVSGKQRKQKQNVTNEKSNDYCLLLLFFRRTGKILLEIEIPAKQVTSVAFGGPNLDILYVTTAATARDAEQPPLAGHLFKVTGLGVKGLPGVKVRV